MRIKFSALTLQCRKSRELIPLSPQISYFHGPIAAGKSSLVKLIDYCLGGELERTPAIAQELVSVQLSALIGQQTVLFERQAKQSSSVQVVWQDSEGNMASVLAPIAAHPEPIWETAVYNLSDLIFYLSGITPIKVRKSKQDESSQLVRLSFRDIMWYCYLEQDTLDSSFYQLEHPFRGLKSRDAMRFFTGFFTERMNDLEIQLDEVRNKRQAKIEASKQISSFLEDFGYGYESDLAIEMKTIEDELESVKRKMLSLHEQHKAGTHFVDDLRAQLRVLDSALAREEETLADLIQRIAEQRALKAELMSAKFKLARTESASAILSGVSFERCPACGADLTNNRQNEPATCALCGRHANTSQEAAMPQAEIISRDLTSRIEELTDSIERHTKAQKIQEKLVERLKGNKAGLDDQLTTELANYDSAFLAQSRESERRIATLEERKRGLERAAKMPQAINVLIREASDLKANEDRLIREIMGERGRLVDADSRIKELETTYLDSLLRVGVPGIGEGDRVEINRRTWIPSIIPEIGDSYSFYNAGSGGKKTLLNVCYALALHKVASQHILPLPTFLIIDTPMKNIGEDVNEDIFRSFYQYLYELASGPLADTQFIIVDKEYFDPKDKSRLSILDRYMSPKNPLISYYSGP